MQVASRSRERASAPLVAALVMALISAAKPTAAAASEVVRDVKTLIDNTQLDLVDILTSPLHIADENSVFRSPTFYLVFAGVAGLWAGSFALDQTMRSHLHNMNPSTADLLQNISTYSIGTGAVATYGGGLYAADARLRQADITGGEGAVVATLVNVGIKAAFGRLRPRQDAHDHDAWFQASGRSFASGDVTPLFALAAGISEGFDNEWYVAAPAYSLALLDGFGRMGHDAHWFSDVVGAGLLGCGTTELFLYLHARHAEEPSRWRFFPLEPTAPQAEVGRTAANSVLGIEVAYDW